MLRRLPILYAVAAAALACVTLAPAMNQPAFRSKADTRARK